MTEYDTWDAEKLFRTAGSYWEACTLQAGVKLKIFTTLGNGHMDAGELARKLGSDLRGVTVLLNALAAMGLLIKKDNCYANTSQSKTFLVEGSTQYMGNIIMHQHYLVNAWTRLPEAVENGTPVRERPQRNEEELESFLMGMLNLAMASAPQLAAQIDLSGRRHLLDLGGGPGTYAIHFCLANPGLTATIFDLPATEPFAVRTVRQFSLENRIEFVAGNYLLEEIEGSYDAAWLSHILHGEGPEDCERIIQKTVAVMKPGSVIFVQEFILDDTLDHPLFPALFSLNMLINTPQGRSYSEEQLKKMLTRAGLKEIKRVPYRGPNDTGIICGTV